MFSQVCQLFFNFFRGTQFWVFSGQRLAISGQQSAIRCQRRSDRKIAPTEGIGGAETAHTGKLKR